MVGWARSRSFRLRQRPGRNGFGPAPQDTQECAGALSRQEESTCSVESCGDEDQFKARFLEVERGIRLQAGRVKDLKEAMETGHSGRSWTPDSAFKIL